MEARREPKKLFSGPGGGKYLLRRTIHADRKQVAVGGCFCNHSRSPASLEGRARSGGAAGGGGQCGVGGGGYLRGDRAVGQGKDRVATEISAVSQRHSFA